ncbi:iron ABC transporter permease [Breoghania sp.]|uniref:FecCD family ABC transporter permease n=1 Tax=Breoghania sp. TaxID=2065378 RepID=UPI0026023728|nr:iron ABC transporter permease [Breoghania sp.]MDJ0932735.1 iron ABC transporter permease [Breoghania sp.]
MAIATTESHRDMGTMTTRELRRRLTIPLLVLLLLAAIVASATIGATDISMKEAFRAVGQALGWETVATLRDRVILFDIRLPRTTMGILVGAGLATSGAMMQGFFRNPLADPALIGISAGAALAAVTSIVIIAGAGLALLAWLGAHLLPISAFIGALVVTFLLYSVATRAGRTSVATMLLAGIAFTALAMAIIGLIVFDSTDTELRDFTFWNMGSLGGATWTRVIGMLPFFAITMLALPFTCAALHTPQLLPSHQVH